MDDNMLFHLYGLRRGARIRVTPQSAPETAPQLGAKEQQVQSS